MNGRDRDDGAGTGILKLGLGMGVGFAIYMLVGGTGGFGFGRGAGAGPGPGPGPGPAAPPRPRDTQPVEILVKPLPSDPKKAVIDMGGTIVSVGDLIARIDAGGRRDVLVRIRGDTLQGGWDEIHDALQLAGLQIILKQTPIGPAAPTR